MDKLRNPVVVPGLARALIPSENPPKEVLRPPTRVRLFTYDAQSVEEVEVEDAVRLEDAEPIRQFRRLRSGHTEPDMPRRILWADVDGVDQPEALEAIGRVFGLHPLVLEDIANTEQRAKLEDYGSYVYIVARMLVNRVDPLDPSRPHSETSDVLHKSIVASEQVSLILGPGFLVSIQEADPPETSDGQLRPAQGDVFDGTRRRLRAGTGQLRKLGADYLAYALLDAIVDNYFSIVERLGERAEVFEEDVISNPSPELISGIHVLRRDMLAVRRAVWPMREVLGTIARGEEELFTQNTRVYVRDVADHAVEVIDTVETLRDIVTGLLETHLSSTSNRLNEVMKVLTIISTIFIPLTFLTGVYGMNFVLLYPNQANPYGFWFVMGVSLVIVSVMLLYFRRKRWM